MLPPPHFDSPLIPKATTVARAAVAIAAFLLGMWAAPVAGFTLDRVAVIGGAALGVIGAVVAVLRVSAEAKRAEAELRASQARLESALEAGAIGTWTWDIPTDRLTADEFTARMFSLEPAAAAAGLPCADYLRAVVDEDQAGVSAGLAGAIAACGHYDIEYRVRRAGAIRWIQAKGRVEGDAAGKAVYFHGAVMDITDRKEAERALGESGLRFRQLADAIPQLAWKANSDGSITWYNQRWHDYTGTTFEQMSGMGWKSVHDPAELPRILAKFSAAVAAGEPWEDTFPLRRYDGAMRWHLSRAVPIKDIDGHVVRWFGTNTDITEQRDMAEELRRARAELEDRVAERTAQLKAANKELEAFSYSVSHDLRAPLRAIDGFSRIVVEDFGAQLPPDAQTYLADIRDNAKRMGQLVDDLLAFSRLGRKPVERQTVSTARLVSECLGELRGSMVGRRVELRVGELADCEADPALLKQVWANLLANALKYSGKREVAVVEVGTAPAADGPAYFVRDNGVGFDMKYAHKLFGVFQRLHRAEDYEGTGVGLAIVQRIVHRHGGRAWAESTPDRGATLFFTIPPPSRAILAREESVKDPAHP